MSARKFGCALLRPTTTAAATRLSAPLLTGPADSRRGRARKLQQHRSMGLLQLKRAVIHLNVRQVVICTVHCEQDISRPDALAGEGCGPERSR
eukprot:4136390-Prymnesium_polylepis.1